MISAKLLHAALNKLQLVMSWIDMGDSEVDPEKRHGLMAKARDAVRDVSKLLEEHVQRKERERGKK